MRRPAVLRFLLTLALLALLALAATALLGGSFARSLLLAWVSWPVGAGMRRVFRDADERYAETDAAIRAGRTAVASLEMRENWHDPASRP
jgi:hypothetical protein